MVDADVEPVRKKQRLSRDGTASNDCLYAPFRALGCFSTGVPLAAQLRSSKGSRPSLAIVTATTSSSWALWTEDNLQLKLVSENFCQNEATIAALQLDREKVYAAAGNSIHVFERGRVLTTLNCPTPIATFIILASQCIALSEDGKCIHIWSLETSELYATINLPADFVATTLLHPATYVNKIVVGSKAGSLALYNTQTCSLIHTFLAKEMTDKPGEILAIEQSPEVDILAIAFSSRTTSIFDIRQGQRLLKVDLPSTLPGQNADVPSSISFRTDNVQHHLAVSTTSGLIAVFDLDSGPDQTLTPGRLIHKIQAHTSSVSRIYFVPNQPLLVSNSGDNSIKQWFFDQNTGPRCLRYRSGHQHPISHIRYYGNDGKAVLSSSQDAFRCTSIVRDSRSFELAVAAQKGVDVLAWNNAKARDWDDLVAVLKDEHVARTFSVHNKRLGKHVFDLTPIKSHRGQRQSAKLNVQAKAVEISACANFVFVGGKDHQEIQMWNLQSGERRRTYTLPANQSVAGLATDALNKHLVASTTTGALHFFDFHDAKLLYTLNMPSSIDRILLNRTNDLLAVICDDFAVRIVDIQTRRLVREMTGFRGAILDMDFSHDGRWLVIASADSLIRTFDLPTSRLIDIFRTPNITTSLSFSPTGDFLATCQLDSNSIYLWTNRAQFTHVMTRSLDEDSYVPNLNLPEVRGEEEDQDISEVEEQAESIGSGPSRKEQLHHGLLSLSLLPRSKWQTLLNLEQIQARNKPVEAPKAPEKAPFFLPRLSGTQPKFDLSRPLTDSSNEKQIVKARQSFLQSVEVESDLLKALKSPNNAYEEFFRLLVNLPPSSLDLEIRSLADHMLEPFVRALISRLQSAKDFEAVQAILSVFLTAHHESILNADNNDLQSALHELIEAQEKEAKRLNSLVGFSLGTLAFVRGLPTL